MESLSPALMASVFAGRDTKDDGYSILFTYYNPSLDLWSQTRYMEVSQAYYAMNFCKQLSLRYKVQFQGISYDSMPG